jgi:DNA-binding CsgD family transcriptional regulator
MAGRATHGPPATHELHTRRSSYELGARRIAAEPGTEIALVTVRRAHAGDTRRAAELFQTRFGLSQRETEVARLLISGRQNADIARDLGISASTARHHTQRVLDKLGVHSRAAIPSLVITRADEPEPRDR